LRYAKDILGLDHKKVILMGDSAGGALSISLTTLSIMKNFRVPDAIIPIYPSTISSFQTYWPSLLNSFDDPVLSYSFLNLVSKAFTPEGEHYHLGS
jgi:acetyl esterase/lipase